MLSGVYAMYVLAATDKHIIYSDMHLYYTCRHTYSISLICHSVVVIIVSHKGRVLTISYSYGIV